MLRVFSLDLLSIIVYINHMKTTKGENTMTIEELNNKVDSLLAETNEKMTDLIDKYNESNEDKQVDTVDLDYKFTELSDYIYDYSE